MRTLSIALVVVSLATAANAAAPDKSTCRKSAGAIQKAADVMSETLQQQQKAAVTNILVDSYYVTPSVMERADEAQRAYNAALAEFRDALDALALDVRACKPKD